MTVTRICMLAVILAKFACSSEAADLAALDDWNIVVAENAIPSEHYAGEEFQQFFERATGEKLPSVSKISRTDRHIFIGPGADMRDSSVGFKTDEMGNEDLRIVIRDDNIAIAGGRPRGTLYGVYTFLEDYLGVRFLTAKFTHVPKVISPHTVGPVDRSYHPPFSYRFYQKSEVIENPVFAVRRRQNTAGKNVPAERHMGERLGGEVIGGVYLHNNFQFGGASFKEHPEYWCLYQGKRQPLQPCLSHPFVRRTVVENVKKQLQHYRHGDTIPLAQNDAPGACQCPRCAMIQREGDAPGLRDRQIGALADHLGSNVGGVDAQGIG